LGLGWELLGDGLDLLEPVAHGDLLEGLHQLLQME